MSTAITPVTSRLNSVQRLACSEPWFSAACKRETRRSRSSVFRLRSNPSMGTVPMDESRFVRRSLSFDHLVGEAKQPRRHFDVERSRRLMVDDELKLGRPHNREVGGFRTLEDAAGIDADLTICVSEV